MLVNFHSEIFKLVAESLPRAGRGGTGNEFIKESLASKSVSA